MPYRNPPREKANKLKKKKRGLKALFQKASCAMGNHEYCFDHEPKSNPVWCVEEIETMWGWLAKTRYGIHYYNARAFCSHCNTTFKMEPLNYLEHYPLLEAWESYVDHHQLGSL